LHWDVYLLKVDPDGNLIWESTWGERSDEAGPYNEKARSVTEVADGGFIVTGTTDHTETIPFRHGGGQSSIAPRR